LARAAPGTGKEGAIQAGLKALADAHLAREWKRDDGAVMQAGRCLIDAGYVPDTVYLAIRRSGRAAGGRDGRPGMPEPVRPGCSCFAAKRCFAE